MEPILELHADASLMPTKRLACIGGSVSVIQHKKTRSNKPKAAAKRLLDFSIPIDYEQLEEYRVSINVLEYVAIDVGVVLAGVVSTVDKIMVYSDSQLAVKQINGQYATRNDILKEHKESVLEKLMVFNEFKVHYIPREQNKWADFLTRVCTVEKEWNKYIDIRHIEHSNYPFIKSWEEYDTFTGAE